MRFVAYTGTSMVLAIGVIIRALHQRTNFYSASVYLAQSNACLMILTNVALLGISGTMLGLQKLFYGTLRPIEVEQLYEKAWFAITETCLAMTIFREDVGGWFMVMFVSLLIGKVWGWIGEGRVEVLEQQPPANPRLFHLRLSASLLISSSFDIAMLSYAIKTVLQDARPNMMVMFAFEFAVLFVTSISTAARYCISLREAAIIDRQTKERKTQLKSEMAQNQNRAPTTQDADAVTQRPLADSPSNGDSDIDSMDIDVPGWEEKGRWIFYLDLTTDFCKLVLYLTFFCVLCMFYGMPIHIIRDVALTIRSFHKRITDFVRYRQATRDMNARYPDATSEEVAKEDCCIICREAMKVWSPPTASDALEEGNHEYVPSNTALDERLRPKKLPCGHVLHFACLRSWLERQQNCPTCRAPVLVAGTTVVPRSQGVPTQAARNFAGTGGRNQLPGQANAVPINPAQNVYQFGPFRIAFGARNGLRDGAAPNAPQGNPSAGIGGPSVSGMGTAFRAARQPGLTQSRTVATFSPMNVSLQLYQIEQQLFRDISSLQLQAGQLHVVRSLQHELSRLRSLQANPSLNPLADGCSASAHGIGSASLLSGKSTRPMPSFSSDQKQASIGSGHTQLPAGMFIPEGWTVLPLTRSSSRSATDSIQAPASHQPVKGDEPQAIANMMTSATAQSPPTAEKTCVQPAPGSDTKGQEPQQSVKETHELDLPQWRFEPPASGLKGREVDSSIDDGATADKAGGRTTQAERVDDMSQPPAGREKRNDLASRASTVEDLQEDMD